VLRCCAPRSQLSCTSPPLHLLIRAPPGRWRPRCRPRPGARAAAAPTGA
jgi:hypothetical protein